MGPCRAKLSMLQHRCEIPASTTLYEEPTNWTSLFTSLLPHPYLVPTTTTTVAREHRLCIYFHCSFLQEPGLHVDVYYLPAENTLLQPCSPEGVLHPLQGTSSPLPGTGGLLPSSRYRGLPSSPLPLACWSAGRPSSLQAAGSGARRASQLRPATPLVGVRLAASNNPALF